MPSASYLCSSFVSFFFILLWLPNGCFGGDPYVFYDWTISYITASPLGDKQQVPLFSFLFLSITFISLKFNFWIFELLNANSVILFSYSFRVS